MNISHLFLALALREKLAPDHLGFCCSQAFFQGLQTNAMDLPSPDAFHVEVGSR